MTDIVEKLNDSLSAGYSELRKEAAVEIMRLRAKIAEMERQEPIGGMLEVSPHNYELMWYRPVPFGAKLYTLPGAQPAPSVPDGWKLVPIEPTIHMCIQGDNARENIDDCTRTPAIYRAMLAAAPEAKP